MLFVKFSIKGRHSEQIISMKCGAAFSFFGSANSRGEAGFVAGYDLGGTLQTNEPGDYGYINGAMCRLTKCLMCKAKRNVLSTTPR